MNANFDKCLDLLLDDEGGFVNNPKDPGGMTNLGVTKAAWESFVGHTVAEKEMRNLTRKSVASFYERKYWDACKCDDIPSGIDYLIFDFAVNAGVGTAVKLLQNVLGITRDGSVGPVTLQNVAISDKIDLISRCSSAKISHYEDLPAFPEFGKGWLSRVELVKSRACSMLG